MTEYPFPRVVLSREGEFTIIALNIHQKTVVNEKDTPSVFVYFAATLSLKTIYNTGAPKGKSLRKRLKNSNKS